MQKTCRQRRNSQIRKTLLRKLKLIAKRKEAIESVSQDFSGRSSYETLAAEIELNTIRFTLRHLDEWTEIQDRSWLSFWPASTYLRPQALKDCRCDFTLGLSDFLGSIPIVQASRLGIVCWWNPVSFHQINGVLQDIIKTIGDDYVQVVTGGLMLESSFQITRFIICFYGALKLGKKLWLLRVKIARLPLSLAANHRHWFIRLILWLLNCSYCLG